jgi:hypothetical protein
VCLLRPLPEYNVDDIYGRIPPPGEQQARKRTKAHAKAAQLLATGLLDAGVLKIVVALAFNRAGGAEERKKK